MTIDEKVATGLWWTDGYRPGYRIHDAIAEQAIEATDTHSNCPHFAKHRAKGHWYNKHSKKK